MGLIDKIQLNNSSNKMYDLFKLSLVSNRTQQSDSGNVIDHLNYFLGNYDKESEFGRNFEENFKSMIPRLHSLNKDIARDATLKVFNYLQPAGYDMMVAEYGDEVIGHNAFQKHMKDLHIFSTAVNKSYQGNGLAYFLEKAMIQYAKKEGFSRIRIGAGGCSFIQHVYEKLCKETKDSSSDIYGVVPEGDQWLRLGSIPTQIQLAGR